MGSLILTAGTKRLAAHYNEEFDTFIEFYRQSSVIEFFDTANSDNVWDDVITQIKDDNTTDPTGAFPDHTKRGDKLCLLPGDKKSHPNLLNRWRIYLKKFLPPQQHTDLLDAIYKALSDSSYSYIVFDTRQSTANPPGYAIDATDHQDSDTNKYMLIVLVTAEMPVNPGFGPNYIRDQRPV
jgi:hypothetical protein